MGILANVSFYLPDLYRLYSLSMAGAPDKGKPALFLCGFSGNADMECLLHLVGLPGLTARRHCRHAFQQHSDEPSLAVLPKG